MSDNRMMLGCMPVAEAAELGFTPYKDSTITHCSECNCEVWLGPEQRKRHDTDGWEIICMVCVLKRMEPGEALPIIPLTGKKQGD
jgi:hypothetical protein